MRKLGYLVAATIVALSLTPAFAADSMGTMSMMKGGEVMTVMPNGHMGTMMVTDPAMMGGNDEDG